MNLSDSASDVADYYNNWEIKTKNPNDSGIIKDYSGSNKKITDIVSNYDIVKTVLRPKTTEYGKFDPLFIEKNEYLMKYSDKTLYSHQKNIYSIFNVGFSIFK